MENEFENAMKIIERGLFVRDKAQIGLKWPLASASIKAGEKISKELEEIIMNQLNVKKLEVKVDKNSKEIEVELDTKLTPELEAEGFAREISRKIQALRKTAGLVKDNLIELFIFVDKELCEMLNSQKEMIKDRTNSKKIEISSEKVKKKLIAESEDKIKDKKVWIGFNKL